MKKWTTVSALALVAVAGFAIAGNQTPSNNTAAQKPTVAVNRADQSVRGDLIQTLNSAGNFKTLLKALEATQLTNVLKQEGPFTFFAPTDDAFAALPPGTIETLMKPENKEHFTNILKFHLLQGKVRLRDAIQMKESSQTLAGQTFSINSKDGVTQIGTDLKWMANVTAFDQPASNGVVHFIDRVIMPRE